MLIFATHAYAGNTVRVYVEAPAPCYIVDSVDRDKIWLKHQPGCDSPLTLVGVDVGRDIKTIYIYADGKYFKQQPVHVFNTDTIAGRVADAKKYSKNLSTKNAYEREGKELARQLYEVYQSPEYQRKIAGEVERLKQMQPFKQFIQQHDSSPAAETQAAHKDRLYIFVSSSMPIGTLRAYAADVDKLGDPNTFIVLRGFVGGIKYIRPTMNFISDIIKKDPACKPTAQPCESYTANIIIDPMLYRRFNVTVVPTIVYVPQAADNLGGSDALTEMPREYYSIMGDASLEYMLDTIARQTKSARLKSMIKRLNATYYSSERRPDGRRKNDQ